MPERALVFGVDTQIGLTVARELHSHGVEVYGIGHSHRSVGLYSRAVKRGWALDDGREPIDLVNELARAYAIPFLLVIGESDIAYFNARRSELESIRPLIPASDKMDVVLDKARVAAIAADVGIETPDIHRVREAADIETLARDLTYPVVLKWANPFEVIEALNAHGLPLEKLRYCYDQEELARALHRYDPVGRYPLVQSFAPGFGLGQMLFIVDGSPLLKFQHRRIHEWPPEGGSSSLCESLPSEAHPELMQKSIRLLEAIEWEGAAMVEYRHDPKSGRSTLMEINGRFWGSQPLAYKAGAHFAWLTYAVLGRGQRPAVPTYRPGLKSGFLVSEVKWLYRVLFRPELIEDRDLRIGKVRGVTEFVRAMLDPRTGHYIFEARDPMPALADVWFALKKKARSPASAVSASPNL